MACYLLHFDQPYKKVSHYIGWTYDNLLEKRMEVHRKGRGSKLVAAVIKAGIGFKLVRIWENGDRKLERKLKNRKKSRCLCPVCIANNKTIK